jgi:D-apionolactonase
MLPKSVLQLGSERPLATPLSLRAGELTMAFDPVTAMLRHVRLGDHEILRGVYGAVRDGNWDTIQPALTMGSQHIGEHSFQIEFQAACQRGDIDFLWKGTLAGNSDGTVEFVFDGEARSQFCKNRIGLCVLHPIQECAGKRCSIRTMDGSVLDAHFPRFISPHQPFKNIAAIRHEVLPGIEAEVRFDGEIFEMEDQRNWTDASFKTYSTPLDLPFPVEIPQGTRVVQKVTLALLGQRRKIFPVVQGRPPQLSIATTQVFSKPPIGLGIASHGGELSKKEVERIKALGIAHLRADLHFNRADWRIHLEQAVQQAGHVGCKLHLALFLTGKSSEELLQLKHELQRLNAPTAIFLVFEEDAKTTSETLVRAASEALLPVFAGTMIAAGTDAYFAELNRNRPAKDSRALPCYSMNPQVHAFDPLTLVENLAAQPSTIESTQQFCPRAVVVSPLTLLPRFNPNATGETVHAAGRLPPEVDPRQMSLFAAGWTLGSIARLGTAGNVHSLTYFETTGWRGIMETEAGPAQPELFRSIPGGVFPMYHLFADLAGFEKLYPTHSTHPLQVEGLTLVDGQNRRRVLAANLTGETQEIKIKSGSVRASIRYLDETNVEQAMTCPEEFRRSPGAVIEAAAGKLEIALRPFALARIDYLAS